MELAMTPLVYSLFILGNVLAIASAAVALGSLWLSADQRILNLAYRGSTAAAVAYAAMLGCRTAQWGLVPLTTMGDSLSLMVMLALAVLAIQLWAAPEQLGLLCFYLPPLALVAALSMYMAVPALSTAPRPLSGALLTAHVGLVFLAFALFFVAGINSVAYAFQAQRLKHRLTTGLFQMLPSLESLDRDLFRLIKIGYPAFAITLVVGGFWVWYEGQNLSPTWWLSPKIFMAVAMLVFYAFTFHARAAGRLRGPKLAHIVCYGTGTLIGIYLVLALLNVLNYNFYGVAG
jgi:ABC-type uncharacterized transport system permease subunit